MDRDLQTVTEMFGDVGLSEEAETSELGSTEFSASGLLPQVSEDGGSADSPTASERAFGNDTGYAAMSMPDAEMETEEDTAEPAHATPHASRSLAHAASTNEPTHAPAPEAPKKQQHWHEKPVHYTGGEPLPVLKTYLQGEHSPAKLRAFIEMMQHAPTRPGAGVKTPISPADGLAGIITGVVLMICDKYSEVATAKQRRFLQHTAAGHERLLSLPLARGGHRRQGIVGHGNDGIAGPTRPYSVVTANQTAVVLVALLRLANNPRFKRQQARLMRLYKTLAPEFKGGLLELYDPHKKPHDWKYGSSGRLEDQSHLKTTYEELKVLAHIAPDHDAQWFDHQVQRIAYQYPHIKKGWDENESNVAGSLTEGTQRRA